MHAHVRENFFVAQIFMRGVGRLLRDNFQQTEAHRNGPIGFLRAL
jgi:hypothetical protein